MTGADRERDERPGLSEDSSIASVQSLYDRWAGLYDWNPVLALVGPARRPAVNALALSSGDTAVDMGTGTGANLPLLREAVGPEGRVIGIDVSPRMLGRARRRIDRGGWDNVTLVRADVRDPPLGGTVDGILSTFVVVMYADPGRLVETWAGYLDDGAMANLYAGPSPRRYSTAVNPLLGLYLRVFEEGWDTAGDRSGPLSVLAGRGRRAREAMARSAPTVERDSFVFGLAQLDVGRFAADRSR